VWAYLPFALMIVFEAPCRFPAAGGKERTDQQDRDNET
jgi:hypothetical protein